LFQNPNPKAIAAQFGQSTTAPYQGTKQNRRQHCVDNQTILDSLTTATINTPHHLHNVNKQSILDATQTRHITFSSLFNQSIGVVVIVVVALSVVSQQLCWLLSLLLLLSLHSPLIIIVARYRISYHVLDLVSKGASQSNTTGSN
jgi:hypothetical protein